MKKLLLTLVVALMGATTTLAQPASAPQADASPLIGTSFWSNWYIRGGLDMTLVTAYGEDFRQVFPKGKTFGVVFAGGKWFSPEIGLRLRLKIDNNIFKNGHLKWIGPLDDSGRSLNYSKGGFTTMTCEVPLSLTNIVRGYKPERTWNVEVFPRFGLISNMATSSGSPLVGGGFGVTYRLPNRWSIFADAAYQVTTSEFYNANTDTGMGVSTGCNGFFDITVGIQFDLGKKRCTEFRQY